MKYGRLRVFGLWDHETNSRFTDHEPLIPTLGSSRAEYHRILSQLSQYQVNVPFLYPLNTSENI